MVGSDGFGVDLVVCRVSAHEADVNDASVVVDFHDKTVGIALDVEDDAVSRNDVGGWVALLDVVRLIPTGIGGFFIPGFEWLLGIGVAFPEFPQRFHRDDSHATLPRVFGLIKPSVPF